MEKFNVLLTESAYQDLDRITDHLMERSPAASYRIDQALMHAYQLLETFPLMGPEAQEPLLRQEHYRKLVADDHITLYRFLGTECVIDHVFHGKQDYQGCFSKWVKNAD